MIEKLPIAGRTPASHSRLPIDVGGVPPCGGGAPLSSGGSSAGFQPAVSQVSNLRAPHNRTRLLFRRSADWKSATQQIGNLRYPLVHGEARRTGGRMPACAMSAFSMVELLVAMTLLSLIVLALMAVFNSTQQAFRSSVTQTDILEGSRAAMEMMANDMRTMAPSDGGYNPNGNFYAGGIFPTNAVNFVTLDNSYANCSYLSGVLKYQPIQQTLPGSGALRKNVLNYFFLVGRQNMKWTGVGYVVNATNSAPLYPLYRFYEETNISVSPLLLYSNFVTAINQSQWTNMSHVLDGVIGLTARPFDPAGYRMTNSPYMVSPGQFDYRDNVWFVPFPPSPIWGEVGCMFFSNAVPAAVELQMAVVEDRTLQRTESLGSPGGVSLIQSNYLSGQSGHVHLFRQRVMIPNIDPSAYH